MLLTIDEAAAEVNKTRRTIENWIKAGLPVAKVEKSREGKVIRRYLRKEEVRDFAIRMASRNPVRHTPLGAEERTADKVRAHLTRKYGTHRFHT